MKGKVETGANRVPKSHLNFNQNPGLLTPINKNLIFGRCFADRSHPYSNLRNGNMATSCLVQRAFALLPFASPDPLPLCALVFNLSGQKKINTDSSLLRIDVCPVASLPSSLAEKPSKSLQLLQKLGLLSSVAFIFNADHFGFCPPGGLQINLGRHVQGLQMRCWKRASPPRIQL